MNSPETRMRMLDQIRAGHIRFSLHAHQEMVAEGFSVDDVLAGFGNGELLEDYPSHKRGACALSAILIMALSTPAG